MNFATDLVCKYADPFGALASIGVTIALPQKYFKDAVLENVLFLGSFAFVSPRIAPRLFLFDS